MRRTNPLYTLTLKNAFSGLLRTHSQDVKKGTCLKDEGTWTRRMSLWFQSREGDLYSDLYIYLMYGPPSYRTFETSSSGAGPRGGRLGRTHQVDSGVIDFSHPQDDKSNRRVLYQGVPQMSVIQEWCLTRVSCKNEECLPRGSYISCKVPSRGVSQKRQSVPQEGVTKYVPSKSSTKTAKHHPCGAHLSKMFALHLLDL